ncbi:MAG: ribosome maturation factor RimM [Acidobacteriota bacterium]|nr:ribosome maturation factor RimM [Acidobacteriota bacterium]
MRVEGSSIADQAFITVARVVRAQGRRGEVAADLHTDFPERFAERKQLSALAPDGSRRRLQLEEFWLHKGRVVLKFAGVDSITDAEALAGYEVQVPAAERVPLPEGAAYISDLVGTALYDGAKFVGKVSDVQAGAGAAPLLVVKVGDRELLVPFVTEFIKSLDLPGKRLEMALPAGLLDLDAPLTEEEKQEQQSGQTDRDEV